MKKINSKKFLSLFAAIIFLLVLNVLPAKAAALEGNMLGNCEPYYMYSASIEDFSMAGTAYKNGIKFRVAFDHTTGIGFNLGEHYETLSFDVGHIDGTAAGSSDIVLTILADNEQLQEIPLNNDDIPKKITLDVSDVSQLNFVWSCRYYDSYFGMGNITFTGEGWPAAEKVKTSNMVDNCEPYSSSNMSIEDFKMGTISYSEGMKFRIAFDRTAKANFNFGGHYESITFDVGHIDGTSAGSSEIKMTISLDDKEYLVLPLSNEDIAKTVTVPLKGVHQMTISWSSRYYDSWFGISGIQLKSNGIVRGIIMKQDTLSLSQNNPSAHLKAVVVPNDANNTNITWLSSDPSVATVNADGLVTGVSKGEAVIYAITEEGNFECTCTVTADFPYNLAKSNASLSKKKLTYTGNSAIPAVTVTYDGTALKENVDYTVAVYDANGTRVISPTAVGRYTLKITGKGNYAGSKQVQYTIVPAAPKKVTANLYGYDDVKVTWSKCTGASGYAVYYKLNSASEYTLITRTSKLNKSISGLKDGKKYIFKVVPYYLKNGTRYTSITSKTASIYTLKQLNKPKVSTSGTKVKVKWNNINGETGYQISRSKKQSGTNVVLTKKTTSGTYTTVKATKGTKYYYKVRAYKVNSSGKKIFGPWSKAVSYKR